MPDPIDVASGVRVPPDAMTVRAVRSSGPGGQNVNKVASRVELAVEVARIEGLDDGARERLAALAGRRLRDGRLHLSSQETRDRHRNLERVRERVRELVAASLVVPKRRRKTRPRAAARETRLAVKKREGVRKALRRPPAEEE